MTKYQNNSMKVITVNIPKVYIKYIKEICDKEDACETLGFEPSTSEFIRHAIKDKIMRDEHLEMFFSSKRGWEIQERVNKLEKDLTLIKVPHNNYTRKPLGNNYYCKGMNEE